jgi:hypothetical protein
MIRLPIAAVVLVLPAAALAQAPSAAQEFAQLYVPAVATTSDAEAAFRKEAARALTQEPQFTAMEAQYPNLRQTVLDAGARVMREQYVSGLPAIQNRVAALASKGLTTTEQREVVAFLRSGTGQAMQQAVRRNIDTGKLAEAAHARPNAPALTQADVMASMDVVGAMGALTPEQVKEVATFSTTPTGRKFQQLVPQLMAAITEETNRLIQNTAPKVQQAMLMAMRSQAAPARKE